MQTCAFFLRGREGNTPVGGSVQPAWKVLPVRYGPWMLSGAFLSWLEALATLRTSAQCPQGVGGKVFFLLKDKEKTLG